MSPLRASKKAPLLQASVMAAYHTATIKPFLFAPYVLLLFCSQSNIGHYLSNYKPRGECIFVDLCVFVQC